MRRFIQPYRVTIDGLKFDLNPIGNFTEHEMFLYGRLPELASISFLLDEVRGKRALVFDIGANCGGFTVPLARAVAAGSRIVAVEPNPTMAARLRRNLCLNHLAASVEIQQLALGDHEGYACLNLHATNSGQSSLLTIKSSRHIEVPVRKLTSVYDSRGSNEVFAIKADVEGFEDRALVPLLESVDDANLPDVILIETVWESRWELDLRAALKSRGFIAQFEGDENIGYKR